MRKDIKNYSVFIGAWLLLFLASSCSDDTKLGLPAQDGNPPAVPIVKNIENTNGAATIYYEVPADDDLLYVMAAYTINGVEYSSKSSPYKNSVKVEGFGKKGDYEVKLMSVDKSQNSSASISVTISPLESPVEIIYETLKISPSFGGLKITWDNVTESNIIVNTMVKDSLGDWVEMESFYSSVKDGSGAIRGLDTVPKIFGVKIRDRWDNYSELLTQTEKPLYEVEMDKGKFKEVSPILPGDAEGMGNHPVRNMWDGIFNADNCYHSAGGSALDKFVSFDMGQVARLSRYKIWERKSGDSWTYSHNNLKHYKIYGCVEITVDMRESGSLDGWTFLYDAHTYKPSGEGPVTNEDKEYIMNGDEHEFPLEIPAVRYIRILMLETWSGGTMTQIGEMAFWGQPQK